MIELVKEERFASFDFGSTQTPQTHRILVQFAWLFFRDPLKNYMEAGEPGVALSTLIKRLARRLGSGELAKGRYLFFYL